MIFIQPVQLLLRLCHPRLLRQLLIHDTCIFIEANIAEYEVRVDRYFQLYIQTVEVPIKGIFDDRLLLQVVYGL